MTTQDKSIRATLENILQPVLKKGIDHRPEIAAIDYLVTLERKSAANDALNTMHGLLFVRLLNNRTDIDEEYWRFKKLIMERHPLPQDSKRV